jgi:hypothetical protein
MSFSTLPDATPNTTTKVSFRASVGSTSQKSAGSAMRKKSASPANVHARK